MYMNLNIKTTNFSLTQAISDYLEKKLRSLDRIIDWDADNVSVQAELGKITEHHNKGDIFRAEINVNRAGHFVRAVSEKSDLYAAIDEMKDTLAQELKHGKDKHKSLVRRGAARIKNILKFGRGADAVF